MKRFLGLFLIVLSFACVSSARADDFAIPKYENMVNTLIRYGALNIKNNEVLDEYSIMTECKLYQHFYDDEFKWQKFREAMRQKLDQDVKTFPTGYRYDTKLHLDRYSFEDRLYRFSNKSMADGFGSFLLRVKYNADPTCAAALKVMFPFAYRIVLARPLYLAGLPFTESEARGLMDRLNEAGNKDRTIYVRFNFRIVYIAPVAKNKARMVYEQLDTEKKSNAEIRMDARLDSVNFYEDEARTKLLYVYRE